MEISIQGTISEKIVPGYWLQQESLWQMVRKNCSISKHSFHFKLLNLLKMLDCNLLCQTSFVKSPLSKNEFHVYIHSANKRI